MKQCSRCKGTKDFQCFYPDSSKKDGHSSRCKQCQREVSREKHWADPEASRARMREYSKTERAKASSRRRANALRDATYAAYGNKCACCGETEPAFLTVDHRSIAGAGASNIYQWLKREGYPQDGTIQLLCWNCNCAMGVRGLCPHRTGWS